jgi:hypothetical protein
MRCTICGTESVKQINLWLVCWLYNDDVIQWVPGALSLWVERPRCEADHSPSPSTEVKNAWNYISTPQFVFMVWCSVQARGQIYFYLNSMKQILPEKLIIIQVVMKFPC